ncbi:uncharacterized protein LOC131691063 isoform X2 [Topomyia yanbarensis]|uniref:uncharacterized protein LOC131691063 isoform X2 n=1 Tax=Topomyia yanbarensis TaxID=2498891 RepID=UPI00273CDF32|nr:uncharacterized protein LOC131691063 isoform X2 [Topomyia yanbarensis]
MCLEDESESVLHRAVRETLVKNQPYDEVIGLIRAGVSCAVENSNHMTPAELALSLGPAGEQLARLMVQVECDNLPLEEAFKRILVRGNLSLVRVMMAHQMLTFDRDTVLSGLVIAFAELRTRNVGLSAEIVDWVQYSLVEADYKCSEGTKMKIDEINCRTTHLIECIEFLEKNYSNGDFGDMDDRFVLYLRQILEHVFFLKNHYKAIPLLQLQFCLAIFMRVITGESDESQDIYGFMVDKDMILDFLKSTKEVLITPEEEPDAKMSYLYLRQLHDTSYHRLKKATILTIRNIVTNNSEYKTIANITCFELLDPHQISLLQELSKQLQNLKQTVRYRKCFKNLFKTYQAAKQFYSVRKIIGSIRTIQDLDMNEPSAQLTSIAVLKRSLQIIGEAIKSTKQTPNITRKLDNILQIFSSQSFAEMTKDLRQFFSHDYSLEKLHLEQHCPVELFRSIHRNLKLSSSWLSYVQFLQDVHIFKRYLARLLRMKAIEQMRSYVRFIGTEFKARLQSRYEPHDINEALLLVQNLMLKASEQQERHTFEQIERLLIVFRNTVMNDLASVGNLIDNFFFLEKYIKQDVAKIERVRVIVQHMLAASSRCRRHKSVDKASIKMAPDIIMQLRMKEKDQHKKNILEEIWRRLVKQNVAAIESLKKRSVEQKDHCLAETLRILKELGISADDDDFFQMLNQRLSKKYYRNLFDLNNKYHVLSEVIKDRHILGDVKQLKTQLKLMRRRDERYFQSIFDGIVDTIRNVLLKHGDLQNVISVQLPMVDVVALEYFVLLVGEILCSIGIFNDNLQSVKAIVPIITGRNLRNYLAHDQLVYDVLTSSSSSVKINALFLAQNKIDLYNQPCKHEFDFSANHANTFEKKLVWFHAQHEFFAAVKAFDVAKLECLALRDPINLLGRDHLNRDVISMAMNAQPSLFINQLLNSTDKPNLFEFLLRHSPNFQLKHQINQILARPHQFCYSAAIRFELIDQLLDLRSHREVNTNLSDTDLERFLGSYTLESTRRLVLTLPVEHLLHGQRLKNTIIHWAVLRGDLGLVQYVLDHHRSLVNETNVFGETPLGFAVRYGYNAIARLLIRSGADVNSGRCSPVWIASCLGDADLIPLLVNKRTDKNPSLHNPLVGALENNNLHIFIQLCEQHDFSLQIENLLHRAIQLGRSRFLQYILKTTQAQTLIHSLDPIDFTPLMTAAVCGQTEFLLKLLNLGADPCFSNQTGYTPLHCAVYSGKQKIVEILLQQPGVDIDAISADDKFSPRCKSDVPSNPTSRLFSALSNSSRTARTRCPLSKRSHRRRWQESTDVRCHRRKFANGELPDRERNRCKLASVWRADYVAYCREQK